MKWISGLKPRFKNQVQTWKWKTWKWKAEFQVYFKKSNVLQAAPKKMALFDPTEELEELLSLNNLMLNSAKLVAVSQGWYIERFVISVI